MRLNRSVLVGVTFAYLLSLLCGFIVARILSQESYNYYVAPTFEAMDQLEIEQARAALQQGGPGALASYLRGLDRVFGGRHALLNADGTDLVTGAVKKALLPPPPATRYRGYLHQIFHLSRRSDDGLFWFTVVGTANEQGPATWAYFLVCLLVTTGLLFFSLLYLVFPLRRIRDALSEFGHGKMQRRLPSERQDEIGQLASSFNAMAEQIETSFRTERVLLQDVSHELRAPLARLSLAVHLARQEHDHELLVQIESNVQRLTSLVAEITTFHQTWSTLEADRPLETVELDRLVQQIARESTIEASMHSVELVVTTDRVVLHGARPDLMERVLGNVLRNAILHACEGTRVETSVVRDGEQAIVTVRDFGKGVPPELLERIFEPFYREQDGTGTSPGLGLGLSIARRGAQWHGGTLRAENAHPGLKLIASFPLTGFASVATM